LIPFLSGRLGERRRRRRIQGEEDSEGSIDSGTGSSDQQALVTRRKDV
jgi:hypothetical protein